MSSAVPTPERGRLRELAQRRGQLFSQHDDERRRVQQARDTLTHHCLEDAIKELNSRIHHNDESVIQAVSEVDSE